MKYIKLPSIYKKFTKHPFPFHDSAHSAKDLQKINKTLHPIFLHTEEKIPQKKSKENENVYSFYQIQS